MEGTIGLETMSKRLAKSISEIFSKDDVLFSLSYRRDKFVIVTTKKNKPSKLFSYFVKNTDKWYRLKEAYGKSQDIEGYEKRYNPQATNKVTVISLRNFITEIGSCDIEFLMHKFNCKHGTIMNYINVLKNNRQVRVSRRPKKFNPKFISTNTTMFLTKRFHNMVFSKLKEIFAEYKEFANYTGWHKGTISAWKVRKNRIPIHAIKEICKATGVNHSKMFENIKETDRMVIEAI